MGTKRPRKKSLPSSLSTSHAKGDGSPFAPKTVLQAIEDYSDQEVVREVEQREIRIKSEPQIDLAKLEEDEVFSTIGTERFVFFDLETGGLSPIKADILEIAAVSRDDQYFSTYVKSKKKINPFASRVNRLTCKNGDLMFRGKIVESKPLDDALIQFLDWLKKIGNGSKVVLVAHNSKFDSRFIIHNLVQERHEHTFLKLVAGFIDTIPIFKKIHPGFSNYKQDFLVSKFLQKEKDYDAHSAVSDVNYLRQLFIQELEQKITDYSAFGYTSSHALKNELLGPKINNVSSFKHLIRKKVISSTTATKLSALEYRYDELVAVYKTKGDEGLKNIFTQPDSKGCPRITASDIVLAKILNYFRKNHDSSN